MCIHLTHACGVVCAVYVCVRACGVVCAVCVCMSVRACMP